MQRNIVRVLLDSPVPQLDRLFDYEVSAELGPVPVGARVRVPLRSARRVVEAYVVELAVEIDPARSLSAVESVVSPVAVLPANLYQLARAVADRAAGSAADIVRLVVPNRQVRVEKSWEPMLVAPAVAADALVRAQQVLEDYDGLLPGIIGTHHRPESSKDAVANTQPDGTEPSEVTESPEVTEPPASAEPRASTELQEDALQQRFPLQAQGPVFRAAVEAIPALLDAPSTGDEAAVGPASLPAWCVLLAASATAGLARGNSSILVVPDYRDVNHLCQALDLFVDEAAVVRTDSRQSNPDRYRNYLRMLDAAPCIVVGNRSAVYAPVRAGLVMMWDDGDSLLAEPMTPAVHARDAALVRSDLMGSNLVFVSHSRSTDVQRLVDTGWLQDISAKSRYRPKIRLSTEQELERRGERVHSSAFRSAQDALLVGPILIQVARPGFVPSLVCQGCGAAARCQHCAGPISAAAKQATPGCTWCGREAHGWQCGTCSGNSLRWSSSGSERTAQELGRAFPGTPVIVADSAHPIYDVPANPALVVATRGAEPVAAGGYAAVILLDGNRMLQNPQLRTTESCLRWWSNAAALATRGAPVHLVGVSGSVTQAFATWNHAGYARQELGFRAQVHLPPAVRVARLSGTQQGISGAIDALANLPLLPEAVLGPVPDEEDATLVQALVRFPYRLGPEVAHTLRSEVVSAALHVRKSAGGRAKPSLSVRMDVLEPDL